MSEPQVAWAQAPTMPDPVPGPYSARHRRGDTTSPLRAAISEPACFRVQVFALGPLQIHVGGKPVVFGRKLPRKPLALLKCLVAQGGEAVSQARLIHAVWPGETAGGGYPAFWLALHRLRALLAHPATIELSGGCVRLRPELVWVDVFAFEHALGASDGRVDALYSAISLYRGPLLDGDDEHPCVLLARERFRRKLVEAIELRGHALECAGQRSEACLLYRRGLDIDGASETFHQGLIRCLLDDGKLVEALNTYRRLWHLMSVTLGRGPSSETHALMARASRAGIP